MASSASHEGAASWKEEGKTVRDADGAEGPPPRIAPKRSGNSFICCHRGREIRFDDRPFSTGACAPVENRGTGKRLCDTAGGVAARARAADW